MGKPQVNLVITQEERDVLDAVALLEQTSAPELLRTPVREFLAGQRDDPEVQSILRALETRRAKKAGKLSDLREQLRASEARKRR